MKGTGRRELGGVGGLWRACRAASSSSACFAAAAASSSAAIRAWMRARVAAASASAAACASATALRRGARCETHTDTDNNCYRLPKSGLIERLAPGRVLRGDPGRPACDLERACDQARGRQRHHARRLTRQERRQDGVHDCVFIDGFRQGSVTRTARYLQLEERGRRWRRMGGTAPARGATARRWPARRP